MPLKVLTIVGVQHERFQEYIPQGKVAPHRTIRGKTGKRGFRSGKQNPGALLGLSVRSHWVLRSQKHNSLASFVAFVEPREHALPSAGEIPG